MATTTPPSPFLPGLPRLDVQLPPLQPGFTRPATVLVLVLVSRVAGVAAIAGADASADAGAECAAIVDAFVRAASDSHAANGEAEGTSDDNAVADAAATDSYSSAGAGGVCVLANALRTAAYA